MRSQSRKTAAAESYSSVPPFSTLYPVLRATWCYRSADRFRGINHHALYALDVQRRRNSGAHNIATNFFIGIRGTFAAKRLQR
jgi:hypothetical protein